MGLHLYIDFITHLEGSARLLRVFEGDKAVAGLPLLIRELAVRHGEKLFVQVASLFDLVKLVVRGRRQEQEGAPCLPVIETNADLPVDLVTQGQEADADNHP